MSDERELTVPCRDGVGRDREVSVSLAGDGGDTRVAFVVPPGEGFTVDYQGLVRLLTVLGYLGKSMRHGIVGCGSGDLS